MSAEGILDNPAIFFPTSSQATASEGAGSEGDGSNDASFKERRKLAKKLREVERLEVQPFAHACIQGLKESQRCAGR